MLHLANPPHPPSQIRSFPMEILHHFASLYHSFSHLNHTMGDAHDEMTTSVFHRATETVEYLRLRLPEQLAKPRVAIVCGSGLGGLANVLNQGVRLEWAYKDVPNFPVSTGMLGIIDWWFMLIVESCWTCGQTHIRHSGRERDTCGVAGWASTVCSLCSSRPMSRPNVFLSFYEGHSMETVTFATRVCKVLGVETMCLTNAAGGLNPDYRVGDIVCLNDHLNLAGLVGFHPLKGPNAEEFGVRFPPMSDAYDIRLRQLAHRSWQDVRNQSPGARKMHEGVYAFVAGPTYETRAECRMLHNLGADVVGMSTVPEIIVARHCGMKVLAFSLVTNNAVLEPTVRGDNPELQSMSPAELDAYLARGRANHEEVLEAGKQAALDMEGLVLRIVSQL